MKMTLAFYVGRGNWVDSAIRTATGSAYSHVEMLAPYEGLRKRRSLSISSSPRDGGVRVKEIDFKLTRWAFLDVEAWRPERTVANATRHLGARYDWRAIAFTHAVALGHHSPARFTCSELIGGALGLAQPHRITPGGLYHQVSALNHAYLKGRLTGLQSPS